ncbi:hypothetical protein [Cupriavidus campinensis]
MNRSDLPSFTGLFCLFAAFSTIVAFYWIYTSEQARAMSIIPGSTLLIEVQWALVGGAGLFNIISAVALLRQISWAKFVLVFQLVYSNGFGLLCYGHKLPMLLINFVLSTIPLLIVARVPLAPVANPRQLSASQRSRRIFGLGVCGLAAFVMYVTLVALFTGTSPAANAPAMTNSIAVVYLSVALAFMWIGGAIFGETHEACRICGILLTAFASYMVYQCCTGYLYARIYYPQVRGLYHWDATLQWLVILAMIGFSLLGSSRDNDAKELL